MASLKEQARALVHRRDIGIATYQVGEDAILAEGSLVDDRMREYYLLSGEACPAGVIHHMIVRMLIEGPGLVISEIEVEMPGAPRPECSETIGCLAGLRGMPISRGFSRRVKELAGGEKGCAHLVNLVLAMAPAALQGYWAMKAQRRAAPGSGRRTASMDALLKNTCRVWREDGPTFAKLKRHMDGSRGRDAGK